MNISVFAGEKANNANIARVNTVTATTCENFEPMSKNEYIKIKAQAEGISYSEANKEINKLIARDLKKYGVPGSEPKIVTRAIEQNDTEYQGDGLYYIYGYVYFIDTYAKKMKVRSDVPVIIASHHYGRTFADVTTSKGKVYAYSSGGWTLEDADATVYTPSNTQVKIQYTGVITVLRSVAISIGADYDWLSINGSVSKDGYTRTPISKLNKEILKSSN
nr:hypothetical protein [uncultured Aminipila sp.]